MRQESHEPYPKNKDQVIMSSDERYLFQYELTEKSIDDVIAKGNTSKALRKAQEILKQEIDLMKGIITEKDPIEKMF